MKKNKNKKKLKNINDGFNYYENRIEKITPSWKNRK